MRLVKDAHELALMRRAAQISARAHVRAMQHCAQALRAGQEVREYHLEAELLHDFAATVRRRRPTTPSSPPAPTPACCTTAPTARRCAAASWC
jgi:Xaa-Pro aminopeptidase